MYVYLDAESCWAVSNLTCLQKGCMCLCVCVCVTLRPCSYAIAPESQNISNWTNSYANCKPCVFLTFLTIIPLLGMTGGFWAKLCNEIETVPWFILKSGCCATVALSMKNWINNLLLATAPQPGYTHKLTFFLFLAQQDISLAIEISGIGVDFILHAANTFSSLLQVRCTFQHFCLSRGEIPRSKHFGITDNSP